MTLFEYMSVAISLVVALTFAEGLRGLRSALQPDRRYIVHAIWLFIKISNPVTFWWAMWGWRDIPEYWNFATFLLAISIPCLMFLQVSSLVGDTPYQETDWRTHFYRQRKWFFGLQIILGMAAIVVWSGLIPYSPAILIPMFSYIFLTLLCIVGFLSERAKVHSFIAYISLGFNLLYFSLAMFRPVTF